MNTGNSDGDSLNRDLGQPVPQTADPIDRVVRLAPKWTMFVLLSCALLIVGIGAWAVGGTVVSSEATAGVYNERGAQPVVSEEPETVKEVLVLLGQEVDKGEKLFDLEDGHGLEAPQDGVVTSILASAGAVVPTGTTVARVTDPAVPDKVVTLVPAPLSGTVVVGQPVRIEVSSAPSTRYGYLLGTIEEISSDPYTVDQFAGRIGQPAEVVESLLGKRPGLLATITLRRDSQSATGYAWSVGDGPPFAITQGVATTCNIVLSEQHPIDVVFPGRDGAA